MANDYFFNGDDKDYFMKSSWTVWTDASGTLTYVGKTNNEKTFSPQIEETEWWDNTSGVQTLFLSDICKAGLFVQFSFMQVAEPDILALAWNLDYDNSDADSAYLYHGSNPNSLGEYEWRFAGQTRSGLGVTLVIRKGPCIPNGDWATGVPCEFTNIPVTVKAYQDTNITDTKRDIAYWIIDKKTSS